MKNLEHNKAPLCSVTIRSPLSKATKTQGGWETILGGIAMFQRVGVERETKKNTRMSMEVIVTSCCKLVYFTYLPDLQPTYIGVIKGSLDEKLPSYEVLKMLRE